MTNRFTAARLAGLAGGLATGALLAATCHGYAAPQVGGEAVKPAGLIVPIGKGNSGTRFFGTAQTIKPPPSPRVRDHRGGEQKFVAPSCGHRPRPCKDTARDHRSK